MKDLSQALRDLRVQIESGLSDAKMGTGGLRITPEQVTLTLALVAGVSKGDELTWEVATAAAGSTPVHSLTIQFRLGASAAPSLPTPVVATESVVDSAAPVRATLSKACEAVFGLPGFDNAARAEVFCELVDQHSLPALQSALTVVAGGQSPEAPPPHLTSRLRQLLGFAPAGREAAANELLRLLQQCSPNELCRVIAERWRFGTYYGGAEGSHQ